VRERILKNHGKLKQGYGFKWLSEPFLIGMRVAEAVLRTKAFELANEKMMMMKFNQRNS
jgi:hypothetical protein